MRLHSRFSRDAPPLAAAAAPDGQADQAGAEQGECAGFSDGDWDVGTTSIELITPITSSSGESPLLNLRSKIALEKALRLTLVGRFTAVLNAVCAGSLRKMPKEVRAQPFKVGVQAEEPAGVHVVHIEAVEIVPDHNLRPAGGAREAAGVAVDREFQRGKRVVFRAIATGARYRFRNASTIRT